MREPEPETIRRARSGDLRAFESLVRDAQADVWRFAYHLTRNRAIADDVTQETFIKAYLAIGAYRHESRFSSWLLRIARNCAMDAYRRARRDEALADDVAEARRLERVAGTAGAEDRIRIDQALRSLPPHLREPFVVIEVLGFGYREASIILGVRVGTLKSRMFRARAVLIAALSEEAAGER